MAGLLAHVREALARRIPAKRGDPAPRQRRDPFYDENERWAAINAAADKRRGAWIPRRPNWLRK